MDNEHSLLIIHWIPLIPSKSCNDQVWACRSHRRKRKGIPEDPLGEFEWNLPWYGCDGVYFKWMEAATSTRNEVNFISDTGLFFAASALVYIHWICPEKNIEHSHGFRMF